MVRERNSGPLRDEEILRLFREIMSACLAQQEPLKVAFLGPEGTFTQTAVLTHFGHSVRALPLTSIDEVFHEVEAASADFGVVPIENSTEGTVNHTLDRFLLSPLKICGEVELRIHHNLMGQMGSLGRIVRICSHPQSLAQCRVWLDEHMPSVEQVPVSSNAEGARRARDEKGTAAIAGQTAAEVYGLKVLAAEIEDRSDNTTRFLVLGRKLFTPSGEDRTTLLVSVGHTDAPGALSRLARAAGEVSDQHDPHRVASLAPTKVGLRVFHRLRGTRGRAARGEGARGSEEALVVVSGARVVSPGRTLRPSRSHDYFCANSPAPPAKARYRAGPGGLVAGELTVPGDKSISHRALMFGGIAEGDTEITGFLAGEDCLSTLRALQAMGVRIERPEESKHVLVHGVGPDGLRPSAAPLDMGNAGTAIRLFMGLLCAPTLRLDADRR